MRRPSFFGAVRAEAIKVSHQLSFWLMLVAGFVLLGITVAAFSTIGNLPDTARTDPSGFARQMFDVYGTIFQIGSGIVLLIVGSRLIAMEYSSGTVRIAYARGIGRLQLLLAKMVLLAIIGVGLLVGWLLVVGSIVAALYANWTGGLAGLDKLDTGLQQDFGYWLLAQGISMGVVILLAAAMAGLGRSLAFAMAASLAFFPVDNFLVGIMALTARATRHDSPWRNITEYLLGPNLNSLVKLIEPDHGSPIAFAPPLNPIDGHHALLVIGAWAVLFAVIAIGRAVRPDVLE
ncbi:MAG TPA: ABC transporter permease [Candidatus Dormibacteraeota bacterium]|jgi:ABC-type transport system involved in multi-copper enzyme maturation permease subunit